MEENKTECVVVSSVQDLGRVDFDTNYSLQIEDGVEVDRVLSSETFVSDTKFDILDKKAVFSGKLTTRIVFLDKVGVYVTAVGSTMFSHSFNDAQIVDGGTLYARDIVTSTLTSVEGGDFVVKANTSANIIQYSKQNHCVVSKTQDNIYCKTEDVSLLHTEQMVDSSFNAECELEVKGNISKILSSELKFVQTDCCALENAVAISGQLLAQIVYSIEDENGVKVCSIADSCMVKGEIEAQNVDMDSIVDIYSAVDNTKTIVNTTLNDNTTTINLESTIVVNGVVYKMVNQSTIVDAYSTKNAITTTASEKSLTYVKRLDAISESLIGEVRCEGSAPDEILAVGHNEVSITRKNISRGQLTIEGVVEGNVLYRAEDGSVVNQAYAVPFQIEQEVDDMMYKCVQLHCAVDNIKSKIKRADLITLDISLNIFGALYYIENRILVSALEVGEPISFGNAAYQIYIAQPNEDLWSLCKRLKVDANVLSSFNNLELPLKGGERIFVQR